MGVSGNLAQGVAVATPWGATRAGWSGRPSRLLMGTLIRTDEALSAPATLRAWPGSGASSGSRP